MTTAKEFAPAKINLTLHVTGQRQDGYHLLDSLVMFADLGDTVTARLSDAPRLTVSGPMADGVPTDGENLVLRAAALMGATADIHLDKHLPAAAGIGGGSSNAAATLRALSELTGRPVPSDVLPLGADVPVCLSPNSQRMRGIGEWLDEVPLPGPLPAVLVNPRVAVPTPEVFRRLAAKTNPPMGDLPAWASAEAVIDWIKSQRNDLEAPAIAMQPVIREVLDAIAAQPGARLARMSGSGATCFGLFATEPEAHAAARALDAAHPDWWVRSTVLG